ncbi:MAG: choice-of-anchor L domain-containing protein [Deltaproteobacteria bacterium]|nr:choice-of-anchor L domain-containing protein [Deltaproteobacteria bacterium]
MVVDLRHGAWAIGAALLAVAGCEAHGIVASNVSAGYMPDSEGSEGGAGTTMGTGGAAPGTTGDAPGISTTGDDDPGGSTSSNTLFDVGHGGGSPIFCEAPHTFSCDGQGNDIWNAIGVGCPGGELIDASFDGHPHAVYVHEGGLGTHGVFSPREGERMVILSTGRAADIPRTHEELGCSNPEFCPSTAFDNGPAMYSLPLPIDVRKVDDVMTCDRDPTLVGEGDCSNTLEDEWMSGTGAHDYAEMRMRLKVPEKADAFIYQFAFFSAEYPAWANHDSQWNDMYIAWLESEKWTGNISFDQLGNPISINGVFLDFFDAPSPSCEATSCESPELEGFAMEGHAGTRWLETVAPVEPGEEIEVVFSIFDMSDASYDTIVLLDNVHWGCTDLPPVTAPQG